jgi:glyoxylase-like metal-dependent hydrolase (beta-lactamase superfamily II)/rhodanese-related sulfurtransferase
VADTHVHSDYLSGAAVLAARHRVPYLLSAEERVEMDRLPVQGGDVVPVGALEVQVLDTPGHTLHHQSYVVRHGDLDRPALFSGGSLLHGTVGRTDLVDPLLARLLGRAQWQSAQHQAVLPSATSLHPTHGFGSLCSATSVAPDEDAGTVGHERRTNAALTTPRDAYVEALVEGFGPVPSYYRHLVRLNRKAPDVRPSTMPVADVDEVAERAQRGEWVLDVRPRAAYAEAHLPGSVGIELGDSFATWAGWVTPWGADLTLVADRHQDLELTVHDLAQIGIGVGRVHLLGAAADWPAAATVRRVGWREYATSPHDLVLDVRHAHEHAAGYLPEARHVPLPELWREAARLPPGRIWLYCRSGFRATVAAGLLARFGREVVVVDDDWSRAESAGLGIDRAA